MTQQELIEQNVRLQIGDLHLQLIFARARIAELEEQLANLQQVGLAEEDLRQKQNGEYRERAQ